VRNVCAPPPLLRTRAAEPCRSGGTLLQTEARLPTVVRYVLLQIPGWLLVGIVLAALVHWLGVPRSIAAAVVALVIVKDVVLYPFVRSAYEGAVPTGAARMVGVVGRARDRLAPTGYVLVNGELWQARAADCSHALEPGVAVRVRGVDGSILLVTAATEDA